MAIKVTTTGQTTFVKKIILGTPIRSVVQTTGTLVLCGDRLFAIEMKHLKGQDEASYQAQLKAFLDSFTPAPV